MVALVRVEDVGSWMLVWWVRGFEASWKAFV